MCQASWELEPPCRLAAARPALDFSAQTAPSKTAAELRRRVVMIAAARQSIEGRGVSLQEASGRCRALGPSPQRRC